MHAAALQIPGSLQHALATHCPWLWAVLQDPTERSIRAHAQGLWLRAAGIGVPRHPWLVAARHAVRGALADLLRRCGESQADEALAQFDRFPLLQTSDHAQLLLDPVTFYTNLPYWIGAHAVGARFLFVNTCSTVTLETRAGSGPGWLNVAGQRINLFGLSRRALARTSVCAPRDVRFVLRSAAAGPSMPVGGAAGGSRVDAALNDLRDLLQGSGVHASPAMAFETANAQLWQAWDLPGLRRLVYTDDRLTAMAAAAQLEDSQAVLRRLLFDPALRARFVSALQRAREGIGGRALPATTDFFWGLRAGRLRPLRLDGETLAEPQGADGLCLRFEPDAIAAALRSGLLFPDLCVGFLVLAILPRIFVVGGSSQLIYLRLIVRAMREALADDDRFADVLAELSGAPEDGWLAGLIEAEDHPLLALAAELPGRGLLAMAERWAEMSLYRSVGTGRLFRYIEDWADAVP